MLTFSITHQNTLCVSFRSKCAKCISFHTEYLHSWFLIMHYLHPCLLVNTFLCLCWLCIFSIAATCWSVDLCKTPGWTVYGITPLHFHVCTRQKNGTHSQKKLLHSATRGQKLHRIPLIHYSGPRAHCETCWLTADSGQDSTFSQGDCCFVIPTNQTVAWNDPEYTFQYNSLRSTFLYLFFQF